MHNWKKTVLAGCLSVVTLLSACGGADKSNEQSADSTYEKLNLAMAVNGTDIATDTKVANYFAELVEEESGGNIKISVFPNDQLAGGNATKGIEMVTVGAYDLAAYASSTMSVLDEQLLVGTIPWIFDNYEQARSVIDSTGGKYYEKILANRGLTYMGSAHNGFRQISNSTRAVKSPEDVKGLKIRVPGGEVYMKFFKSFGADPVAMSWSEAFTAIQQGTIDGQENGFSVTNSAKVYEIQDYMTVWNYTYENYLFVANSKVFENFSPETQKMLKEKCLEACEWGRNLVEEEEEELKEKFTGLGVEVTELSSEELVPFKETVSELREYLFDKYGDEACQAFGIAQ